MLLSEIFMFSGTVQSIVCVVLLVTTWCLLPQWRTLQNFISVNQVITGTLFIFILTSLQFTDMPYEMMPLTHYILITSVCWSVSSSLLAYLRLVLVYVGKISCEKRKAVIFAYGNAGIILGISLVIVPNLLFENYSFFDHFLKILLAIHIYMLVLNFIIFIRIVFSVLSCCKTKKMSKRKIKHVASLIGVAFICDSLLILIPVLLFFSISNVIYYLVVFFICHRLVFQTMFVLFRRSTRLHWKLYINKRKRRKLNHDFLALRDKL
ncbi:uncharacterized protein LOC126912881 [Spodoptera frugiperda]|uniref:Uncharacterized protein LOC126912881 n=1 Tax=Spodoptera frugiperda TaxID=7108 RepID=A0A9R0F552_SPOFR|nr:uncharacterized protein LOC126912881 [Spodoptera frugiperda]